MTAEECRCRCCHGGDVERARHPPHAIAIEGWWRPAREDAVKIVAGRSTEARIEARADLDAIEDRNRARLQVEIHGIAHGIGRPVPDQIEVRDLS